MSCGADSPIAGPRDTDSGASAPPFTARNPVHVILDNFRSAYNVGAVFRTADAIAAAHVHLCGMSAHPPHKKLEKTALGAYEYVPWTYYERTKDAIRALKLEGIAVVAAETAPGAIAYTEFAWTAPVAVIFGNEEMGISPRNLARCDAIVNIPMAGQKNTLNVATAAGVVLFEIVRQWRARKR